MHAKNAEKKQKPWMWRYENKTSSSIWMVSFWSMVRSMLGLNYVRNGDRETHTRGYMRDYHKITANPCWSLLTMMPMSFFFSIFFFFSFRHIWMLLPLQFVILIVLLLFYYCHLTTMNNWMISMSFSVLIANGFT